MWFSVKDSLFGGGGSLASPLWALASGSWASGFLALGTNSFKSWPEEKTTGWLDLTMITFVCLFEVTLSTSLPKAASISEDKAFLLVG